MNQKDQAIERLKVLTTMLFESYEKGKQDPQYTASSNRGSVKHLAVEIRKLCSKLT